MKIAPSPEKPNWKIYGNLPLYNERICCNIIIFAEICFCLNVIVAHFSFFHSIKDVISANTHFLRFNCIQTRMGANDSKWFGSLLNSMVFYCWRQHLFFHRLSLLLPNKNGSGKKCKKKELYQSKLLFALLTRIYSG